MTLRVRVIGAFEVEGVDESRFGSRKARIALKRLALGRGAPVSVDALIDALWGDAPPAHPQDQVAVLASRLRNVLGAERLTRSDAGYTLQCDWLDVAEFEDLAQEAHARTGASARSAALAALRLARGELLAGEEGDWADAERAQFRRRAAATRRLAAESLLDAGQHGEAAALAEAALDHDPYDEDALRLVMRAYARSGRPASALAAYARTRHVLAEELGVDPSPETEAVHTALLLGTDATRPSSTTAGTFAGRATELALLDEALADATRGAQAVVISGEAGIGKSRLAAQWARHLPGGTVLLTGRCDDLGRDLPLQPVFDAVSAHLDEIGPDAAAAMLGPDAPSVGPFVGRVEAGTPAAVPTPTTVGDADASRTMLYAGLLATVERAGGGTPTVLLIEDLHQAGEGTLAWLRFALRRARRLLIVCTTRVPDPVPIPGARNVPLAPLDVDAVATIVGVDRAQQIHRRSGGNPLFVVQLEAHDDDDAVPQSLVEIIRARAAPLGDAAATLRLAAVLDQTVDVELVAAASARTTREVLDDIEAGIAAGLLHESAAGLEFTHVVVRDALAGDTTAARRALAHREAAAALRRRGGEDPMRVALHARLGGDTAAAMEALIDDASLAVQRFDLDHASARLDEALVLGDSAAARLARARVRLARSQLAEAAEDVDRAIELGPDAAVYELAGWIAYYRRDYALASRFADRGLAEASDDSIRASCLTIGGRLRHSEGDLRSAEEWLTRAAGMADVATRGMTNIWLGCLRAHQGRPGDALELLESTDIDNPATWTRLGHPFVPAHGLFSRVQVLGVRGRLREASLALGSFDRQVHAAGAAGERFTPIVQNMYGWLARTSGDVHRAAEHFHAALGMGLSVLTEPHAHSHLDLAEMAMGAQDWDGASEELRIVEDRLDEVITMRWHVRQRVDLLRARLALAAGDPARAAHLLDDLHADASQRGSLRYAVLATLVGAEARAASGAALDAEALTAASSAAAEVAAPESWWLFARLGAATGDTRWWNEAQAAASRLLEAADADDGAAETLRRYVDSTFAALKPPP